MKAQQLALSLSTTLAPLFHPKPPITIDLSSSITECQYIESNAIIAVDDSHQAKHRPIAWLYKYTDIVQTSGAKIDWWFESTSHNLQCKHTPNTANEFSCTMIDTKGSNYDVELHKLSKITTHYQVEVPGYYCLSHPDSMNVKIRDQRKLIRYIGYQTSKWGLLSLVPAIYAIVWGRCSAETDTLLAVGLTYNVLNMVVLLVAGILPINMQTISVMSALNTGATVFSLGWYTLNSFWFSLNKTQGTKPVRCTVTQTLAAFLLLTLSIIQSMTTYFSLMNPMEYFFIPHLLISKIIKSYPTFVVTAFSITVALSIILTATLVLNYQLNNTEGKTTGFIFIILLFPAIKLMLWLLTMFVTAQRDLSFIDRIGMDWISQTLMASRSASFAILLITAIRYGAQEDCGISLVEDEDEDEYQFETKKLTV